jgi:hypothetical protein
MLPAAPENTRRPSAGSWARSSRAADVGLLTGHGDQGVGFRSLAAAGSRAPALAGEPPNLDFEPVKQTVSAHLDARFGVVLPGVPAAAPGH